MILSVSACLQFFQNQPLATIVFASVVVYLIFIREDRIKRLLNKFPGPTSLPLFGNAFLIINPDKAVPVALKYYGMYGNRIRGYLGTSYSAFFMMCPNDIEKLLTSNTVIDKSIIYALIGPWLGDGLLLSTGKKWQTRRKALTPAFHFRILDNFIPIMNEQAQILVKVLKKKGSNGTKTVEVMSFVTRCALDIICETAMGKKLNCQQDVQNEYALATLKESDYFWYRATRPWFYPEFMWSMSTAGREEKANLKVLHDFTDQVIRERKAQFVQDQGTAPITADLKSEDDENVYFSMKRKFAFLDLLIREQAKGDILTLTDQDIRDEVDTFMFEGHDTTASAISWTIFLLGLHPEHQATVHAELDSIFGNDKEREITAADLTEMKFLECCIKESLRIFPSVPVFGRQLLKDFPLDDGAIVPQGVTVIVVPFLVHRNPEIYPNPEEFRPSRFFPANCVGRHPFAYIPFSAGPRGCIGQRFAYMEEKVVLATLLRNFRFESVDTRDTVTLLFQLILRPKDGIHVKIFERD